MTRDIRLWRLGKTHGGSETPAGSHLHLVNLRWRAGVHRGLEVLLREAFVATGRLLAECRSLRRVWAESRR